MTGISDYDSLAWRSQKPKGEREALAPYIAHNEPIVTRHWAINISDDDGQDLTQGGVAIFTTDRQLVAVHQTGGLFKPKYGVLSKQFGQCVGVGSRVGDMFGHPEFYTVVKFTDGTSWMARFSERDEMEEYDRDLGGAVGAFRILHGLDGRD